MTFQKTVSTVLADLAEVRVWQEELYRDLHANPELSHCEHRTAGLVADRLRGSGFEVQQQIGGTGVVGVLVNGAGPGVLLRADMDALPVREDTGLPYASTRTATPAGGGPEVPVAHACGHDMHTACLLGAADLLATARGQWRGTLVVAFQPAEETVDGARGMVADGLAQRIPAVHVALGQHVAPLPAGTVSTIPGPALAAADSLRITVYGKGGHASMPHTTVDPVVLAASIVLRLQTIVARELEPGTPAVLTVGALNAGTKSNIIADQAELLLNIRTYSEAVRTTVLAAIERVVRAECAASNCPRDPEIEQIERAPLTDNDAEVTARVTASFDGVFGDRVVPAPHIMGSEDFSDLANGVGAPYTFWLFGGADPTLFADAPAGELPAGVPSNHSPKYAPLIQPTLDTGTTALVTAALTWLAR